MRGRRFHGAGGRRLLCSLSFLERRYLRNCRKRSRSAADASASELGLIVGRKEEVGRIKDPSEQE
jgi:hypothetical protein